MTYPHNDHGFHIPQPLARPGEQVDFSHQVIPAAGMVSRPPVDVGPADIRDHAYALIRVLDEDDNAVGPWDPALTPAALQRELRAMMLTRAYDARMLRVQRQGKTSFYMKCTGEEAMAVAAATALDAGDMCFPTYRQHGLLVARDWPLVDMMNQVYSNSRDRLKGRQMPVFYYSLIKKAHCSAWAGSAEWRLAYLPLIALRHALEPSLPSLLARR
jgi:2-oxoisovalerate dehydrogenase E1 component alpha subunit